LAHDLGVSASDWSQIAERVAKSSEAAGLDLVHPFAVGWFNERVSEADRLHDFGNPFSLGLLLGNTRALWTPFARSLQLAAARGQGAHPLDSYVEQTATALQAELAPLEMCAYFAHTTWPRTVPMQRLAELVGFAALSPVQLSIHSRVGPWFAMRVVLIIDVPGPSWEPAAPVRPCRGCSEPCVEPFRRALALSSDLSQRSVTEHAADWIAVRDACPVGREFRYGEDQLAFHYHLKDRSRG
jgi:hypothetical protein